MKFANLFTIHKRNCKSKEETFVSLEEFINYLRQRDQTVRPFNVKRTLGGYKGGIVTIDNVNVIPTSSLLKYCYNHSENCIPCSDICELVESDLFRKIHFNEVGSTLELYQNIAKTDFTNLAVTTDLITYEESSIKSLITEHKTHFNSEEWTKIVWFECQISLNEDCSIYQTYEEILAQKWKKFKSIVSFKGICEQWSGIVKTDIAVKSKRQNSAKKSLEVEIVLNKIHNPEIIDSEILLLFQPYFGDSVEYVVCFNTSLSTKYCFFFINIWM